jgi:hypothetical protein
MLSGVRKHLQRNPLFYPLFQSALSAETQIRILATARQKQLTESRKTGEVSGHVGRKFHSLSQNEVIETYLSRIWEKKFGRHANHVMKQKDISRSFDRSHPPSGGYTVGKDQRQYRSGDDPSFSGGKSRIPNRIRHDFPTSRTLVTHKEEKSLHPSWEAKKKLQNVAIVPAQGTRIVFD